MMSRKQRWLYWREVKAAQLAVPLGTEFLTKHEENEWRHAIHKKALGHDKSSTEFDNRDLDKVLAELRAISQPDNLAAQLRQLNQEAFRLRYGIRREAAALGGDLYIKGIVKRMNAEGQLGSSDFDQLGPDELKKVRIALTQHERRGAGRIYELHAR